MAKLRTDASLLREIEETPTQPSDIRYLASSSESKSSIVTQAKRLEKSGHLYRKSWHGLTVFGVNWYPHPGEK